jgi:hypothetical protein
MTVPPAPPKYALMGLAANLGAAPEPLSVGLLMAGAGRDPPLARASTRKSSPRAKNDSHELDAYVR